MANPFDQANELARALKESNEFMELVDLHNKVNEDAAAKDMLDNFRTVQVGLQQKQMQGLQLTEEEIQEAQNLFEVVQQNELILKLMEAEQRMSQLITEITTIVTAPLEELYGVNQ